MDPAAMPACPLGAVTLAIALAIALTLSAPPLPLAIAIAFPYPTRRHRDRRRRAASLSQRLSGELTTARPWWRRAWEELATARVGGAPRGP